MSDTEQFMSEPGRVFDHYRQEGLLRLAEARYFERLKVLLELETLARTHESVGGLTLGGPEERVEIVSVLRGFIVSYSAGIAVDAIELYDRLCEWRRIKVKREDAYDLLYRGASTDDGRTTRASAPGAPARVTPPPPSTLPSQPPDRTDD